MEVLKEGRKQEGYTVERDCAIKDGGCGASLRVSEKDMYMTKTGPRNFYSLFHFICPCCGIEANIISMNVPMSIQEKILSKKDFFERK